MRKPLVTIHVAASVGLLGATASSLLLALTAALTDDAQFAHSAYRLMSAQAFAFGIPLSLLALASGIALGRTTKWGVTRYRWTAAKLALLILIILNGAFAIGPTTDARLDGARSEWALVVAIGATIAMLAISVVLSVFKPGGLLRSR